MYLPKKSVDKLDQCAHSVQLELSLLQHSKVDVSSGQANLSNCLSKMTGGTPEVRSDKSLTLMTFNIRHSTNGPMDQGTNGPKISPRYPKDIPKISQIHHKDITKISQRYPKDIP